MACSIPLDDLNLTPEQRNKMNAVMTEHMKTGCTEASETKYMEETKAVMTPSNTRSSSRNTTARQKRKWEVDRLFLSDQSIAPGAIPARFTYGHPRQTPSLPSTAIQT